MSGPTLQLRRKRAQRAVRAALDSLPLPHGPVPDVPDDAPDLWEEAPPPRLFRRYADDARGKGVYQFLQCLDGAAGGRAERMTLAFAQAEGSLSLGHHHAHNDAWQATLEDWTRGDDPEAAELLRAEPGASP